MHKPLSIRIGINIQHGETAALFADCTRITDVLEEIHSAALHIQHQQFCLLRGQSPRGQSETTRHRGDYTPHTSATLARTQGPLALGLSHPATKRTGSSTRPQDVGTRSPPPIRRTCAPPKLQESTALALQQIKEHQHSQKPSIQQANRSGAEACLPGAPSSKSPGRR